MLALEFRGVARHFVYSKCVQVLAGVDLDVYDSRIVSLIDPIGCKSMFLKMTSGEEHMTVDDKSLSGTDPERIMIFYKGMLYPLLGVQYNMEFGLGVDAVSVERYKPSNKYPEMMHFSEFDLHIHQPSTGKQEVVMVMGPQVLNDESFSVGHTHTESTAWRGTEDG